MTMHRTGFGRHQKSHMLCDGCNGEIDADSEYLTQRARLDDSCNRKHYCVGSGAGPETCDPETGDNIPCAHREGDQWIIRELIPGHQVGWHVEWTERAVPATEWVKRRRDDPERRRPRSSMRGMPELLRGDREPRTKWNR